MGEWAYFTKGILYSDYGFGFAMMLICVKSMIKR